jgi:hypothetical protein
LIVPILKCDTSGNVVEFNNQEVKMRKLTSIKAIRVKCLDCSGFQPSEVRNCGIPECPLFPYRMGKNPNRVGIGNSKGVCSGKQPIQLTISH